MVLNFWQCEHPGCTVTATGTGGAIGLRAIGWYFHVGGPIFCPAHRTDPVACRDNSDNRGKPCSGCAGNAIAERIQYAIEFHDMDIRAWWAAKMLGESGD